MRDTLDQLIEQARVAAPNDRIELRDPIAAHGAAAVEAMGEWLADPVLTRFAVRVVGRAADLAERDAAVRVFRQAREDATPEQQRGIDAELHRLGEAPTPSARRRSAVRPSVPPEPGVPGWMMRTNRGLADWLSSELEAGRLRQGWGYQPKQELTLLRHRRELGEPMDRADDNAWPNRRMLSDEPDGMQIGDLVLLPHLPREWRWSVARITGPYRYEIDPEHGDYGHILPAEIVEPDLGDDDFTPALWQSRLYPARLRRLSREAYDDLTRLVG